MPDGHREGAARQVVKVACMSGGPKLVLPKQFKVAVGAGGPAGGAHKGDGLSLGDLVALLDQKFEQWAHRW